MAPPHVYPDPQTGPLSVAPGIANTTSTSIDQLTGPPVIAGSYNKMMFIRVSMFGGTIAPSLFVQAGTGDPVQATTGGAGVFRVKNPNPATDYVGDVKLVTAGELSHVYQIQMGFFADTTETWHLGIQNNDGASRDFTWVVADSIAGTAQPWIVVAPAAMSYNSLINETIKQGVQVSNKGTGPLNINGVDTPLPAAFTLDTPLPQVPPSGTATLTVTLTAPGTLPPGGVITGTTNLTASPADRTAGTSPGHNQQISLTATIQRLEVVLLLDDSGSMSGDKFGNSLPAGDPHSRWGELVSAVGGTTGNFLDLLAFFGQNRGRFGIARFPAGDPNNSTTFDIVPMTDIPDVPGMKTAHDNLAKIVPLDSTPMGDGLDHVLTGPPSYFSDQLTNRRWLILMSDGAHNAGTHTPLEFIAPPVGSAPAGASLADKNVELFAVAYGIDGHTNVNHVLMKQLATGSLNGGQALNVDDETTMAATLAGALRDAIKSGLTPAAAPLDPSGVFVIGPGEVLHEAILTRYDARVAFVLNWNTPASNRLRLELLTPNCELITPENAGRGNFAQVTFCGGDRSQMYLIDPDFLSSAAGARPRYGTWRFRITSPGDIVIGVAEPGPAGGDRAEVDVENYIYDVVVDSTLRLDVSQDQATYFAGDPITVSARLTADGRPVTDASVSLSTTAPAQSVANWLAAVQVPADALNRAKELLAGKDSTPLLVKQLGAQLAGLTFDGGQRQVTLPMSDPDATGTYRATVADTPVPEHYTFYVTATGVIDGVSFRREAKQETFVLVRPDPDRTQLDIRQIAPGLVNVTIITSDRFGNVLLLEPNTAGGFGLVAPGAKVGELGSNLDGTYTSTVTFDPNTNPAIGLQFGGQNIVQPKPTPPIRDLHYVNRVISFEPGAIQTANQHADPGAALGSIVGKPAGTFVSLGAAGRLAVGFYWQVILAGDSGDDITVFIQPDDDLRSYRVEAYAVEDVHQGNGHWVPLGESIGVTQSFSLRAAGLKFTPALQITDTSGRTRDADLKPLSTPGVSVRGVGALQTGKFASDPWPLVGQGDRGHPVQTLQYLLGARGHPVTVDGIFGPATEAAVRAFQQAGHLSVDGVVGPQTWSALVVQVSAGSTGDAVRAVQAELGFRGTGLQVDGVFGPKTDAAVRAFQQALGFAVDGIVGPLSWRALVSGMLAWPVVGQGDRGHPVQTLQYLLGARGHPVTVDGIFGPATEAAVRAFQQAGHLSVDGVVGPQTWSALVVQVSAGSTGDAVRAVQAELGFRGTGLQVDGVFGPKTDAAVRAFQQALGFAVDGIVGPLSWRALVSGMLAWPVVGQGDRGHPVQTLQYLLGARGHPVTVDGIFGPATEAAVRAFQQAGHLSVDGVVGPQTWSALVVQVSAGSTGDAVRAVQAELQFRDLSGDLSLGVQVDGIFGPNTDAAVRGFQQALGSAGDGIVGSLTWCALVSGMLSL